MSSQDHVTKDTAPPVGTIEIRVEHISQLFDTLDPYPFAQRDLDSDAEDFIVGWARELPRGAPITIVLHLPANESGTPEAKGLPEAIHGYFAERARHKALELKELFRIGRVFLVIGIAALTACLTASQLVAAQMGDTPFGAVIEEGLIIFGWVANWRPIEIFLYDWWPLVRMRRLYSRLASASITCKSL